MRIQRFLVSLCILLSFAMPIRAQEEQNSGTGSIGQLKEQVAKLASIDADPTVSLEVKELNRNFLTERRKQLRYTLKARLDSLRKYQEQVGDSLRQDESRVVSEAIRSLDSELRALGGIIDMVPISSVPPPSPKQNGHCNLVAPSDFCLGAPTNKATNVSLELKLGWTAPRKTVKEYILFVSDDEHRRTVRLKETVAPSTTVDGGEFDVKKKHGLVSGETYYWHVQAIFTDGTAAWAENGPFHFTTTADFFGGLTAKGLKLQKALTGPDKGELAEFSFLSTIGQKTVFSTTFALSWKPKEAINIGRTNVRLGASVEAALASDESDNENAWRFRFSSIFTTSFIGCRVVAKPCPVGQLTTPTFEGLYTTVSLKYEGDKNFDVRKLTGEFLITPNSYALAIGTARPGNSSKPIQFQWRPFFRLDAGHTIRAGDSEEKEETILRFVPRVRMRIDLQFLRQWLNMREVAIFADDTYFYLPRETRTQYNFFKSGIEFKFTPNLGFGLTYNNGRSAPKFEKINTLQGVLGIAF